MVLYLLLCVLIARAAGRNEEFQLAFSDPTSDLRQKYERLTQIAIDFIHTANHYGMLAAFIAHKTPLRTNIFAHGLLRHAR